MPLANVARQISKPKTHRGRKFLAKREPLVHENDKQTLIVKGGRTSQIVNDFLTDIYLLKKPFSDKLKRNNRTLPFEDASFIERMCSKSDCSLFVMGMHSKKRPNNVIFGRLHDQEILDMYELGIDNYKSMRSSDVKLSLGSKPILIFSGEAFDETQESQRFKSLLIDMFRGAKATKINASGIEHVIHFLMPSAHKLLMRISAVRFRPLKKENTEHLDVVEPLKTPWGPYVRVELQETAPEIDFTIRRHKMPSEDKWKSAHRVPAQLRPKADTSARKNKGVDIFGSKVAQIHVQREEALDQLRPGVSMRTALTGNTKRGFERQQPNEKPPKSKRQRVE